MKTETWWYLENRVSLEHNFLITYIAEKGVNGKKRERSHQHPPHNRHEMRMNVDYDYALRDGISAYAFNSGHIQFKYKRTVILWGNYNIQIPIIAADLMSVQ